RRSRRKARPRWRSTSTRCSAVRTPSRATRLDALPIDLRRHDVERRDERDEVREKEPRALVLDDAHRVEAPRAEAAAVRLFFPVADDVAAHVAARALDARVGLAFGAHLLRQLSDDLVF